MLSANKAQAGKHGRGDSQVNRLSCDAVKLLKSQDAGYLRVVAGTGRREIDRLEERLGITSLPEVRRKVVFWDEDMGADRAEVGVGQLRPLDDKRAGRGENETVDRISGPGAENVAPELETAMDVADVGQSPPRLVKTKSKKMIAAERNTLRGLRAVRKRRKRLAEMRIGKLEALKKRQKEIIAAANELDLQRAKMARTVGGVNKDGVKWKIRERKR